MGKKICALMASVLMVLGLGLVSAAPASAGVYGGRVYHSWSSDNSGVLVTCKAGNRVSIQRGHANSTSSGACTDVERFYVPKGCLERRSGFRGPIWVGVSNLENWNVSMNC